MLFQEKNQEMEIIRIHFSSWVQTIIVISPKSLSSHLMSFHSKCFVLLFIKRNFKNMLAKQNRWISRHISLPWFKEKKGKKRKKTNGFLLFIWNFLPPQVAHRALSTLGPVLLFHLFSAFSFPMHLVLFYFHDIVPFLLLISRMPFPTFPPKKFWIFSDCTLVLLLLHSLPEVSPQ